MEIIIAKYNEEKAVAYYKIIKSDTVYYYVDWLHMYYLGEKLLSLKRYDDARIIAENNVIEFPEREHVALSMANIYFALKRKEDAIKFYKKTLQLNPQSEEAKNNVHRNPAEFDEYKRLKLKEMELLRTVPPSLNSYYKKKVDNYLMII